MHEQHGEEEQAADRQRELEPLELAGVAQLLLAQRPAQLAAAEPPERGAVGHRDARGVGHVRAVVELQRADVHVLDRAPDQVGELETGDVHGLDRVGGVRGGEGAPELAADAARGVTAALLRRDGVRRGDLDRLAALLVVLALDHGLRGGGRRRPGPGVDRAHGVEPAAVDDDHRRRRVADVDEDLGGLVVEQPGLVRGVVERRRVELGLVGLDARALAARRRAARRSLGTAVTSRFDSTPGFELSVRKSMMTSSMSHWGSWFSTSNLMTSSIFARSSKGRLRLR